MTKYPVNQFKALMKETGITAVIFKDDTFGLMPNKRIVRYKMPVLRNGKRVWVEIEEFDTCKGIVANAEEYFTTIADEDISSGKGSSRKVGTVQSYLLDAFDLAKFSIRWLETTFGK